MSPRCSLLPAIRRLHPAAFDTPDEADLVEALREGGPLLVSLVADGAPGYSGKPSLTVPSSATEPLGHSKAATLQNSPGCRRTCRSM